MIKQLLRAAVARDEVDGFARDNGFARSFDPPWTDGIRTTNWRRGEDLVALITDGPSGATLLAAKGPGEAELARRFGERFGARGLSEEIAEARTADGAAARARASLRLGLL
ncbi:MAG TPA: hypothetical protein VLS89_05320, partial [Candidatus Nanopelagicales bacterium]|nr:hypothetical protein [Candidatus Nanopelagicales bacterium]